MTNLKPFSRRPIVVTDAQQSVARWMKGLEAFRAIGPTMQTQLVYTFLLVATHEGISASEITERSGFRQSTTSRHLRDLGRRNRIKQPGYDLVEPHIDENDSRRRFYTLTPKGRELFGQIAKIMEH